MEITILGNGGAVSDGLPYNAFIIDKKSLIEVPPDIMLSLEREKIPVIEIDQIYISHLHGDHCFGFPFLALRLFMEEVKTGAERTITLFAPQGADEYLATLTEMAVSKIHPLAGWIKNRFTFVCISDVTEIPFHGRRAQLFRMDHYEETYGFTLIEKGDILFSYTADTKWSGAMEEILRDRPGKVIIDLNGERDDPVPVHLSEDELIEKGLPITGNNTIFYGTHLKHVKKSRNKAIQYVKPGTVISI